MIGIIGGQFSEKNTVFQDFDNDSQEKREFALKFR